MLSLSEYNQKIEAENEAYVMRIQSMIQRLGGRNAGMIYDPLLDLVEDFGASR